jgi:hypothetical protein
MRTLLSATLLGLVALSPLSAQGDRAPTNVALVKSWYRYYLRREPDPAEVQAWTNLLRSGRDPNRLLAKFLSSDEYYNQVGKSPEAWVKAVYQDLTGRRPGRRDVRYWTRKLERQTYRKVAYAMVTRLRRDR